MELITHAIEGSVRASDHRSASGHFDGIRRLWVMASPSASARSIARGVERDGVFLSAQDGRRIVSQQDHVLLLGPGGGASFLLGPEPDNSVAIPGVEDLQRFLVAAAPSAAQVLVLALAFRGGVPAFRLDREPTRLGLALHQATDGGTRRGPVRTARLALNRFDDLDPALAGIFHRLAIDDPELSLAAALEACERSLGAFRTAGLKAPLHNTENEINRLWLRRQRRFAFADWDDAGRPSRMGFAADVLVAICVEHQDQDAPSQALTRSRILAEGLDCTRFAAQLPGAEYGQGIYRGLVRSARPGPAHVGKPYDLEVILESELELLLGQIGRLGARGPYCPLLIEAQNAQVLKPAGSIRLGEVTRIQIQPSEPGSLTISATFVPPGLDSLRATYTLDVRGNLGAT
jgi:hypothetical protein